jgi:hypothetical protein
MLRLLQALLHGEAALTMPVIDDLRGSVPVRMPRVQGQAILINTAGGRADWRRRLRVPMSSTAGLKSRNGGQLAAVASFSSFVIAACVLGAQGMTGAR